MTPDERVAAILADWSECQQRGEWTDPADVISANPDVGDELRAGFAALDFVDLAVGRAVRAPTTGEQVGPYRIEELLGSGGMGTVYRASRDGETVALKVIHPHLLQSPGGFKRFLREAEIGREIEHENVVRTLDVGGTDVDGRHVHWIAMEYVEGRTLRELAETESAPETLCRHIAGEIAKGLAAIHDAGAVHRDLKPENVLITDDHVVKVMDLGVALLSDEALRLSQTGAFVGSVEYAAPEQFDGAEVDGRCDLHALGVLLYELSTGQHPFRADTFPAVLTRVRELVPRKLGEIDPQLSPFFEELVRTLLEKDAADRFDSATDLVTALDDGEDSPWWHERARELEAAAQRPLRRIRIHRETATYGREDEIAQLRELYDRACQGDGRFVLVEGEAGIGKSRLIDELVARLRADGEDFDFLFGSYPPTGDAGTNGACSTAFREFLGEAGSGQYLASTPLLVSGFDAFLRGEPPRSDEVQWNAETIRTCFVHAMRGIAAERPIVILIDDLHFARQEGLDTFTSLALAVPGHRVLLIGSMRPGVPADWIGGITRHDHSTTLALGRLGPKALVALLEDAFRSRRLAEDLGGRIGAKSDGNPFFIHEIVQGLRDGGFLRQRADGTWESTRVIEEIEVPSSVLDVVQARLDGVDDDDRSLLGLAACCGFEFDPLLVAQAGGRARIQTLETLARIERRHQLVRSAGRRFVFDHHLVHEAIHDELFETLREEYHASLGDALAARTHADARDPGSLDGALCLDLCEHYLLGARTERAARYVRPALSHLTEHCLFHRVVELAGRALATDGLVSGEDRFEVLLAQAEGLRIAGCWDEFDGAVREALGIAERLRGAALEARARLATASGHLRRDGNADPELARRALADAQRAGDDVLETRTLIALAECLWSAGRPDEALAARDRAAAIARSSGDSERLALAHHVLGLWRWSTHRYDEAAAEAERAVELAGHRLGLNEVAYSTALGVARLSQGYLLDARDAFERALQFARVAGARDAERSALHNLSATFCRLRDLPAARRCAEDSLALARELGDRGRELGCLMILALIEQHRGDVEAAIRLNVELIDAARRAGEPHTEAGATNNLANLLIDERRFDEAQERARAGLALCREIGARDFEPAALGALAAVARAHGRFQEAAELDGERAAMHGEQGDREGAARGACDAGLARGELGYLAEWLSASSAQAAVFEELGSRAMQATALQNAGSAALRCGAWAVAVNALEQSCRIAREVGAHRLESDSMHELGRLAHERGDARAAEEQLRAALALRREHRDTAGEAVSLDLLGELARLDGRSVEARELLEDAHATARDATAHGPCVLAACRLSLLPGGDPATAVRAFDERRDGLGHWDRIEARHLLWLVTGYAGHLSAARELILFARDHAPEEHRETTLTHVRVNREVLAAWAQHGG